jgi:hypothetical protein
MKTLTATRARNNLTSLMKRALNGEDIGIVYGATGEIIALRPVKVFSEDWASMEYGFSDAELKRAFRKIKKTAKNEKASKWDGTVKGLRG